MVTWYLNLLKSRTGTNILEEPAAAIFSINATKLQGRTSQKTATSSTQASWHYIECAVLTLSYNAVTQCPVRFRIKKLVTVV